MFCVTPSVTNKENIVFFLNLYIFLFSKVTYIKNKIVYIYKKGRNMELFKEIKIAKLGEKVLRKKAKKIKDIKSSKTQQLISDMKTCVKKSNGVGLAAPQIFISKQIMIISSQPNKRYPNAPLMKNEVLINPKIIKKSKKMKKDWEGCLSIPGIRALVPRHEKIKIKYLDENANEKTQTFEGFIARIFQHEYDHLIGLVFIDRVETNKDIITEEMYFKQL